MEKIVSLCKRRGFIFQAAEIYGGLNGCWDYGPMGVELKRRIRAALAVDSRVTGIEDYTYTVEDGILHATFAVRTVFGQIEGQSMEVAIA